MFSNKNIKTKWLVAFFILGMMTISIIGSNYIYSENKKLADQVFEDLSTVQQIKREQVESFINGLLNDVNDISKYKVIIEWLQCFEDFTSQGSVPLDGDLHKTKIDDTIKKIKETLNLLDVILLTPVGDIAYSTVWQRDLRQNLFAGELKNSSLADCFRRAKEGVYIQNFDIYGDNAKRILLAAAPVYLNENGKKPDELVGVVMVKMDSSPINFIVQRREGVCKTCSTFLMSKREMNSVRNDSVNADSKEQKGIGAIRTTEYIEKALSGQSGQGIYQEEKRPQMILYSPLEIQGLTYAIITKISQKDAFDTLVSRKKHLGMEMIIGIIVILEVIILILWLSSASLSSWWRKI